MVIFAIDNTTNTTNNKLQKSKHKTKRKKSVIVANSWLYSTIHLIKVYFILAICQRLLAETVKM